MVGGEFTSMPSNIHILYFNCGDGGYEGGGGGGAGFTCFPSSIAGKLYYQLEATRYHRIRQQTP